MFSAIRVKQFEKRIDKAKEVNEWVRGLMMGNIKNDIASSALNGKIEIGEATRLFELVEKLK